MFVFCGFFAAFTCAMIGIPILSGGVDDAYTCFLSLSNMFNYTVTEMHYGGSQSSYSHRKWLRCYHFMWSCLELLVLINIFIAILVEALTRVDPDNRLRLACVLRVREMIRVANMIIK